MYSTWERKQITIEQYRCVPNTYKEDTWRTKCGMNSEMQERIKITKSVICAWSKRMNKEELQFWISWLIWMLLVGCCCCCSGLYVYIKLWFFLLNCNYANKGLCNLQSEQGSGRSPVGRGWRNSYREGRLVEQLLYLASVFSQKENSAQFISANRTKEGLGYKVRGGRGTPDGFRCLQGCSVRWAAPKGTQRNSQMWCRGLWL